jgi:hypothetical protein
MSGREWKVRAARVEDRRLLEGFVCVRAGLAWEVEVERFIQRELFDWAFDALAQAQDPRLLLLVHKKSKALVGVAAHERTQLRYGKRRVFSATKLEVLAVARAWQGRRFSAGERVSDVSMSAVMSDVSARVPHRDARVFAIVHEQNARSLAPCVRHGFVDELSRVHPEYRRLMTAHR